MSRPQPPPRLAAPAPPQRAPAPAAIDLTSDGDGDSDGSATAPASTQSAASTDAAHAQFLAAIAVLLPGHAREHAPRADIVARYLFRGHGNLDAAVSLYLDDVQRGAVTLSTQQARSTVSTPRTSKLAAGSGNAAPQLARTLSGREAAPVQPPPAVAMRRKVGEFMATAYAVARGSNLLALDVVYPVERQAQPAKKRPRTTAAFSSSSSVDRATTAPCIVRFTAPTTGTALGRFERTESAWMGPLLDRGVASFSVVPITTPSPLTTGDDIIVQVSAYLSETAWSTPSHDAKFDGQLRVPLARMFAACHLIPTAAGLPLPPGGADQIWTSLGVLDDVPDATTKPTESGDEPTTENAEQKVDPTLLASVFEKVQQQVERLPRASTPKTMCFSLRPYQEQALWWLKSKEEVQAGQHMHPLFLELAFFPATAAVDGAADHATSFYFNPFDGELQLDMPAVDTQTRGGILADEMGLGKTIEMLALIHANPAKKRNRATLVVVPMSLLGQWESELNAGSLPNTLHVVSYYGQGRALKLHATLPTVVVTTYGIVQTEFDRAAADSPLFSRLWHRIILDEAQHIKSHTTQTAKACCAIQAPHRWLLTGTPIVNHLDDLYSLVRFLQYAPWSQHVFWRHHISIPLAPVPPATSSKTRATFRVRVATWANDENGSEARAAALEAVQNLMSQIMIRRTKTTIINGEPILTLPAKDVAVQYLEMSEHERDLYDALEMHTKTKFSHFIRAGTVLSNYTHILALIMSLRQCCDHPWLILQQTFARSGALDDSATVELQKLLERFGRDADSPDAGATNAGAAASAAPSNEFLSQTVSNLLDQADQNECPLCLDPVTQPTLFPCFHAFCHNCIIDYLAKLAQRGELSACPVCRRSVTEDELMHVVYKTETAPTGALSALSSEGSFASWASSSASPPPPATPSAALVSHAAKQMAKARTPSTKLVALLAYLRAEVVPHAAKCVVFSQFVGMLDLVEDLLRSEGIGCARLDGSQAQARREVELRAFREDATKTCLVASLKACNVGLNLTVANHVVILDPWWNHAVEQQAIDRVHRIGQTRPVRVTRFILRDTVEERMLKVQAAKMEMVAAVAAPLAASGMAAAGEVDAAAQPEDAKRKRLDDLNLLFGM
ncbi:DNA helicase rad5 [Allomyces arbusculus]|nr:DNA helicase rad5 [Allomyces arbusculus]